MTSVSPVATKIQSFLDLSLTGSMRIRSDSGPISTRQACGRGLKNQSRLKAVTSGRGAELKKVLKLARKLIV